MFGKFRRSKAAYIPADDILEIVGEGLVGTASIGDGRMLPVLILDTRSRADVEEYILAHANHAAGDSRVQWAYIPGEGRVVLILSVERPLITKICIGFRLDKHHGILVEQILNVNGLYIQAGQPGDRIGTTFGRPRVVIEVPDTGFGKIWDKLFLKYTAKTLRENGLARSRSKEAAREIIATMRKTGEFRFPSGEIADRA